MNLFNFFKENPRKLFLLDGIGAIVSGLLYVFLIANFENIFGMPSKVVYSLACLAGGYAIYSLTCYFLHLKNWQPFLKIIACANLFHCCFTSYLMFFYYQEISTLGLLYFFGEIIIVTSIAILELKTANQ